MEIAQEIIRFPDYAQVVWECAVDMGVETEDRPTSEIRPICRNLRRGQKKETKQNQHNEWAT